METDEYEVKDVRASGDVAYVWSYISIIMSSRETGSSAKREGHVRSVFRRSPLASGFLPATQTSSRPVSRTERLTRSATRARAIRCGTENLFSRPRGRGWG